MFLVESHSMYRHLTASGFVYFKFFCVKTLVIHFYKKNLKSNNLVKILYSSSTVDCQVYTVTEVIYITVVYCTVYAVVKGTVQRDFRPSVFSSFALAWVKIFSILV